MMYLCGMALLLAMWLGAVFPSQGSAAVACTAPVRSYANLKALEARPFRTPVPVVAGTGKPTDPGTTAAVTTLTQELIACWNGGELLRAYSLYTDDYLARLLYRQRGFNEAAYDALATPVGAGPGAGARLVSLRDAMVLPDGQVVATVVLAYPNLPAEKRFLFVYVPTAHGWLIANIIGEISFGVP